MKRWDREEKRANKAPVFMVGNLNFGPLGANGAHLPQSYPTQGTMELQYLYTNSCHLLAEQYSQGNINFSAFLAISNC